jgi:hypothetical protein
MENRFKHTNDVDFESAWGVGGDHQCRLLDTCSHMYLDETLRKAHCVEKLWF